MANIPQLEGLIQTARHKPPSIRCESNTVNAIPMSPEPLDELAGLDVPDADKVVQRSSSDEVGAW
jgi:hypothetical protein